MTTVYFIRHSKPMKVKDLNYTEPIQLKNEKQVLSVVGEERAKLLSGIDELSDIDLVVASNYVRTISTAKYIADKNNLDIFIDENFGERKQGVDSYSELPTDFEIRQIMDENYKMPNGESQEEVRERMGKALFNILEQYKDKKIVIVSHATAIMFLLQKWCKIEFDETTCKIDFNNELVFESEFHAPEVFKLAFDNSNNLINIENIRPNELEMI